MDESALISAAVSGDVAALSSLLAAHGPQLRHELSIDARWQSVLDIDDILQVTYLEAFLRIGSFVPAGPAAFHGWLRRIADNNIRDAVRGFERQKRPPPARQMVASGGESVVELFELLGVTSATPSQALAQTEMERALRQALELLPEDYRNAVQAYDLEALPIAEAAARCGRSPGAMHMLRARAHARLRELFGANPFLSVSS